MRTTNPVQDWEDRGPFLFSPTTTSTVQKVISYCKDIRGCGEKEYRSVSAAVTINALVDCTPVLDGVLSISGLFYQSASEAQLDMLRDHVYTEGELLVAAGNPCD